MTKFIAIIDFASDTGKMFEHVELDSKNVVDAMDEAAQLKGEDVYLIKIAEKSGKTERRDRARYTNYKEILCNRGHGWKPCTPQNAEFSSVWERVDFKRFVDYHVAIF